MGDLCLFAHGQAQLPVPGSTMEAVDASVSWAESKPSATAAPTPAVSSTWRQPAKPQPAVAAATLGVWNPAWEALGLTQQHQQPDPVEQVNVPIAGRKPLPSNYKTSVCRNWAQNKICQYADACHFAHGEEELRNAERETTSDWNSGNTAGNAVMGAPANTNTVEKENKVAPAAAAIGAKISKKGVPAAFAGNKTALPAAFAGSKATVRRTKIERCRHFANGYCAMGAMCNFAHG